MASCTEKTGIDHYETMLSFESEFQYALTGKHTDYEEIILNIQSGWQDGTGLKEKLNDSIMVANGDYLCIRKNFSFELSWNIEKFLLRMTSQTPFTAFINGHEIFSYNPDLIMNNNPEYNKSKGEIAIYDMWAVRNFFLEADNLKEFLKNGENELAIHILRQDVTRLGYGSMSLSAGFCEPGEFVSGMQPELTPCEVIAESDLPLVFIQTKGQIIPDEPKIKATMGIIYNEEGKNHVADTCSYYFGNIGIELRGHTSQKFAKQSYGIETCDTSGKEIPVSFFGMPEESDWVLYGPYADRSLIRNILIYRMSNLIQHYAVRTQFVELVINDDYRGIYVFMERIEQGPGRVNITGISEADTTGDQLTGGYIIKLDTGDEEFWRSSFPEDNSIANRPFILVHYPKKVNEPQKKYIMDVVYRFEEALYKHPENDVVFQCIDAGSFIDYFILNEISRNIDAYRLSTYLYKDRDSKDTKLYIGPVWDYNFSFGLPDYLDGWKTDGWVYANMYEVPFWWEYLLKNETFRKQMIGRWAYLRQNEFSTENIFKIIDEETATIKSANGRNYKRWPVLGKDLWPNKQKPETWEGEIENLKTWISQRLEWMDQNISKL